MSSGNEYYEHTFGTFTKEAMTSLKESHGSHKPTVHDSTPIVLFPNSTSQHELPRRSISISEAMTELTQLALREEDEENTLYMAMDGKRPQDVYVTMSDLRPTTKGFERTWGDHGYTGPTTPYPPRSTIYADYGNIGGITVNSVPDTLMYTGVNNLSAQPRRDLQHEARQRSHSDDPYTDPRRNHLWQYRSFDKGTTPHTLTRDYRRGSFCSTLPHRTPPIPVGPVVPPLQSPSLLSRLPNRPPRSFVGTNHLQAQNPLIETRTVQANQTEEKAQLHELSNKMERLMGTIERTNKRIDSIHNLVDAHQSKRRKKEKHGKERDSATYQSFDTLAEDNEVYRKSENALRAEAAAASAVGNVGTAINSRDRKNLKRRLLLSCIS